MNQDDLFRVASLVARNQYVGEITAIKTLDRPDASGRFEVSIRTDKGVVRLISWNPGFDEEYSVDGVRRVFLTDGMGYLPSFQGGGIFDLDAVTSAGMRAARTEAEAVAAEYLGSKRCSADYRRSVDALTGRDQQRAIHVMYRQGVTTSGQLVCLIEALSSDKSLRVGQFEVPWRSWEGVYHHHYSNLGSLVGLLLPHLTRFNMGPHETVPVETLKLAWAYWGSVALREESAK